MVPFPVCVLIRGDPVHETGCIATLSTRTPSQRSSPPSCRDPSPCLRTVGWGWQHLPSFHVCSMSGRIGGTCGHAQRRLLSVTKPRVAFTSVFSLDFGRLARAAFCFQGYGGGPAIRPPIRGRAVAAHASWELSGASMTTTRPVIGSRTRCARQPADHPVREH